MNNSMFKPALVGGVALGALSGLPVLGLFNCVCCAWAIGGGLLAAHLLIKDSPAAVTLGRGAGLGLLTGLVGALVCLLFSIPLQLLLNRDGGAATMRYLQEALAKNPDVPPEVLQTLSGLASGDNLNFMLLLFGFVGNLVLFPLFAMIGSAIGVAVFEKRKQDALPPEETPRQFPE